MDDWTRLRYQQAKAWQNLRQQQAEKWQDAITDAQRREREQSRVGGGGSSSSGRSVERRNRERDRRDERGREAKALIEAAARRDKHEQQQTTITLSPSELRLTLDWKAGNFSKFLNNTDALNEVFDSEESESHFRRALIDRVSPKKLNGISSSSDFTMLHVIIKNWDKLNRRRASEGNYGSGRRLLEFFLYHESKAPLLDVNARRGSESRSTPLLFAAGLGLPIVVKRLINYGADVSLTLHDGKTLLDAAEESGNMATINVVRGVMAKRPGPRP